MYSRLTWWARREERLCPIYATTRLGPAHPMEPFALVFLDPPYRMKLAEQALAALRDGGWLAEGALVVVEEAKAADFAAPEGFAELERRAYDDTELVFLRAGQ